MWCIQDEGVFSTSYKVGHHYDVQRGREYITQPSVNIVICHIPWFTTCFLNLWRVRHFYDIIISVATRREPKYVEREQLRQKQNGHYFPYDTFKCIFLNENVWIFIKNSPKFVPKGPVNNNPALVKIMAYDDLLYWRIYASLGPNELKMYWI